MLLTLGAAALLLHAMLQTANASTSVTQVNPHDRLTAASEASSLLTEDLKPWHLKLDVTLFDAAGQNPLPGSIETWRSGKQARTVYSFESAKVTQLSTGTESYESVEGSPIPSLADFVLDEFLSPGASLNNIEASKPDIHTELFGKTKLDCVMLTQSIKHEDPFPIGLFPTYCMEPGSTQLRAVYNFGSHTLLRNGLGEFQGRQVALHISFVNNQVTIADAKVSLFKTFTPDDDTFKPETDWKPVPNGQVRIGGGVIAGAILTKAQPVYPSYAKAHHIGGTVVLRAVIGRDGHIYYLSPVSAPDTSLAVSAIQAVRQWTYKPYLLNGNPTSVDTTITVNYNLNY